MRFSKSILLSVAIGLSPCVLNAQTLPPAACDAPEYRQFDFWIGEWTVDGGQDGTTPVGESSITRVAKGCALHENWRSANGGDGHSLNVYDKTRGQWTQFWIGADGVILHLYGGLVNGAMVLRGSLPGKDGKTQQQRITWTAMDDGRVSQRWETSDDEGVTWQVSFLGFYRRKP